VDELGAAEIFGLASPSDVWRFLRLPRSLNVNFW